MSSYSDAMLVAWKKENAIDSHKCVNLERVGLYQIRVYPNLWALDVHVHVVLTIFYLQQRYLHPPIVYAMILLSFLFNKGILIAILYDTTKIFKGYI
jgi:hypothetical protein